MPKIGKLAIGTDINCHNQGLEAELSGGWGCWRHHPFLYTVHKLLH